MASDPNSPETPSVFETLIENRDHPSLLLPLLFGFSHSEPDPLPNPTDPDRETATRTERRIILVNPFTQSMVVIEGRSSLESLLRDSGGKEGQPPASSASIKALPTLQITERDLPGECVICLDDWEIGAVAKELPCKHRFHSGCIEKWLGFHGNCPVCRFELPVGGVDDGKRNEGRRALRGIWVGFSLNNDRRIDDDEIEG